MENELEQEIKRSLWGVLDCRIGERLSDKSVGEIQAEVMQRLADTAFAGEAFRVENTTTPEEVEEGKLSMRVTVLDPSVLFGRSAGEMREMGFLKPGQDDDVPDCAVFGPRGFTWWTVDVEVTPDFAELYREVESGPLVEDE